MADRAELDGHESVCCDPTYAPITYHWFRLNDELSLIDVFRGMLADEPLTPYLRDLFVGEFRARFSALRDGRLRPVDQVKGPMETETRFRLFELRWRFEYGEDSELRVRAYHVEPKELKHPGGSMVVGLHLHKKSDDASQDAEIVRAGERYFVAKASSWGLV